MIKQDIRANDGPPSSTASEIVIYQTEEEPVRFHGRLLGTGIVTSSAQVSVTSTRARLYRTKSGKFVWAVDQVAGPLRPGEEPSRERIERSQASIFADPDLAWQSRPTQNPTLEQATTRAWYAAAIAAADVARQLYEAVG